jgi:MFS family permease
MSNLGQAIGSFAIGPLAERIGRRYAIVSFALLSCAGVAVQFTASTRWALLIGKIINGICIGGIMACGTTYAADVSYSNLTLLIALYEVVVRPSSCVAFFLDCSSQIAWSYIARAGPFHCRYAGHGSWYYSVTGS